jgi:hypothetical protein
MTTVSIAAKVTKPDGSLYYSESHVFPDLSDAKLREVAEFLGDMAKVAERTVKGKPGDMTAILSQEGIPNVGPVLTVNGFTRQDVRKFQRNFERGYAKMLDEWDDRRKDNK